MTDLYIQLTKIASKNGGQLLTTNPTLTKKLLWKCSEGHEFFLTARKVRNRGKWCLLCGSSKGEREIRRILRDLNVTFIPEYHLSVVPSRRYDYYFEFNNNKYLLEYDGEQHFGFVRKYHKTKKGFFQYQLIDRIKTFAAWKTGHRIIRIDFTQLEHLRTHIINALNSNSIVYLSSPNLYTYITDITISTDELTTNAPLLLNIV